MNLVSAYQGAIKYIKLAHCNDFVCVRPSKYFIYESVVRVLFKFVICGHATNNVDPVLHNISVE